MSKLISRDLSFTLAAFCEGNPQTRAELMLSKNREGKVVYIFAISSKRVRRNMAGFDERTFRVFNRSTPLNFHKTRNCSPYLKRVTPLRRTISAANSANSVFNWPGVMALTALRLHRSRRGRRTRTRGSHEG